MVVVSRVTVTGIYRATPIRVNPRQRNVKAVYKTYIDVIHFKRSDKKRLYEKDPNRYTPNFYEFKSLVRNSTSCRRHCMESSVICESLIQQIFN